jgi:hypothetical protein
MSFRIRFLLLLGCLPLLCSCGIVQPDGLLGDIMNGKGIDPNAKPYCSKQEEDAQRDLKRCMASSVCEVPTGMTFKLNPP